MLFARLKTNKGNATHNNVLTCFFCNPFPARFEGPYPGVKREVWRGVKGTSITDLALHNNYPDKPSETSIVPDFEAPTNEGSEYGSRMQGYFVAPYTGTYSFLLSGNDEAELFFSDSSQDKRKDLFAAVKGTRRHQWGK